MERVYNLKILEEVLYKITRAWINRVNYQTYQRNLQKKMESPQNLEALNILYTIVRNQVVNLPKEVGKMLWA